MNKLSSTIKRMPVNTWNWLRVNSKEVTLYSEGENISNCTDSVQSAAPEYNFNEFSSNEDFESFFINDEIRLFINKNKNSCRYFKIPKGHIENTPVTISFHLEKRSALMDDIIIEAEEDSSCTFIFKYTSEEGGFAHHCGRVRILARKNSNVKVIKAQLMDRGATHTDITAGIAESGAHIHVILAEMGASETVSSCNLVLKGDESKADLDILYLGDGTRSVDISSVTEHQGKKSVSRIRSSGVLLGQSKKIFRDTIDFKSGSSGSRGREEETVLMLEPGAVNLSVPILLCGEDDVEGEHAATSGRPDDKLMFYLMSRGMSEPEAKKLLAEAAFSSVLQAVPDISLRNEILEVLQKSILKGDKSI